MEISKSRLKELELIESKMHALECTGVDNWEGYGIAMEAIEKQERVDNAIEEAAERALQVLEESLHEPSERGAGFSTTESAQDDAFEILKNCLIVLYENYITGNNTFDKLIKI